MSRLVGGSTERNAMPELEQRLIDVDGAVLEVFVGGAAPPTICQVPHPLDLGRPSGVLAELGRLVKVSPRGLGTSSAAAQAHDLTIDRLVDDLEAVRRRLDVGRWVLHGGSAGGEVLLRYAVRYPEAVTALIVVSSPPRFRRILGDARTRMSPAYPQWQPLLAQLPPQTAQGLRWTRITTDSWVLTEDGRPRIVGRSRSPEHGLSDRERVVFEEVVNYQFGDDLGRLHAPALVLHGRNDTLVPFEYGQELSAALPRAEFVAFEDSDHNVANDEPQKYREVVQRFIAAHDG
jgi:proline iminopeptidase